jgi:hypothetical protein
LQVRASAAVSIDLTAVEGVRNALILTDDPTSTFRFELNVIQADIHHFAFDTAKFQLVTFVQVKLLVVGL